MTASSAIEAALDIVDGAASSRVLVLMPTRRAAALVDVVVRGPDAAAVAAALGAAGFVRRGEVYARFGDGPVGLALVECDNWHLPAEEIEGLFARATPRAGSRSLAVPALADELLVLCRRIDVLPAALSLEFRRQLQDALAADSNAWVVAAGRARSWRVHQTLDMVKAAVDEGIPIATGDRRRAAAERGERSTPRPAGVVVALSGLDGAGKSTQAHALAAMLGALGYDVAVRWTRLSFSPTLAALAAPIKLVLRLLARARTPDQPVRTYVGHTGAETDSLPTATDLAARQLRASSPVVHRSWTALVALVNGFDQRRGTRRLLRTGKVVVCDRYVLDSVAHLRHAYSGHGRSAVAESIVRRLSPPAAVAVLLSLPPDVAYRRKPEEYDVAELADQAERYVAAARDLDVEILDACEPADRLAARVAALVWSALP